MSTIHQATAEKGSVITRWALSDANATLMRRTRAAVKNFVVTVVIKPYAKSSPKNANASLFGVVSSNAKPVVGKLA